MNSRPLTFVHRGQLVTLSHVPPDRTLLELLREDLGLTGTKEGCGEGDCGACTVVLGDAVHGRVRYQAVNACIRLAHSLNGMALWTVQDLAQADGTLHPAQQALLQCHGSQCGFCTPGFAMSMFALYQNNVCQGRPVSRALAQEALSGNLCRCTGYRPILDAAQQMGSLPPVQVDEAELLQKLELAALASVSPEADWIYIAPTTQAELRRIEEDGAGLRIGAAVTLTDAFAALQRQWPQLQRFAARFAGLPVRNAGTLGGNVANGSPIGDSMPLLIALRAQVVLASMRGERTLALEDLYTGYRQTALAPDELLVRIVVPRPAPEGLLRAYKVSKRWDDDISAVCLALHLDIADGVVRRASIGAGGVAATPARARQTETLLTGQPWTEAQAQRAGEALQAEFTPISDMRASGAYRRTVLAGLMRRYWLESQGQTAVSLEDFSLADCAPQEEAG